MEITPRCSHNYAIETIPAHTLLVTGPKEVMEVEGVGPVSEPELVSCTVVGGEGGMPLREGLMGTCGFGEGAWEGGRVGREVETGEVRDQ